MTDPDLPHMLPITDPEMAATAEIEKSGIQDDPYYVRYVRIFHHMNVVFDFNQPVEKRVASLQAIRDILKEEA